PQWNVDGRTATHHAEVVANTVTSKYLESHLEVNSLHHQTVDQLGDGLVVTAYAPDGVIEGFESADGQVLGVQWHPELLTAPDPTFRWLVEAARASLT
ncbi:MAG: gamma-glutamyl-gamma-aminobutyrate hydrolase family protein, partial [Actinomycetota bacterium]